MMPPLSNDELAQRAHRMFGRIETLVKSEATSESFCSKFLELLTEAVAAPAGVVWLQQGDSFAIAASQGGRTEELTGEGALATQRRAALKAAIDTRETQLFNLARNEVATDSVPQKLCVSPLQYGGGCIGVCELVLRADGPDGFWPKCIQVVERASNFLSRYLTDSGQKVSVVSGREVWEQLEQFLLRLHQSLDIKDVSTTATTDGRLLLECDRLSLAVRRGDSITVESVSGQDHVSQRSNLVRTMGHLVSKVIESREPLTWCGETDDLASELQVPLVAFLQEAGSRMVMLIPLFEPDDMVVSDEQETALHGQSADAAVIGCLIVEQLSASQPVSTVSRRATAFARHVSRAVANARSQEQVFLLPLWQAIGRTSDWFRGRKLLRTASVAAAIVLIGAALAWLPWNYRVPATGRLMPSSRSRVFAPLDGHVESVHVVGGSSVVAGQPLVQLRNDDMNSRLLAAQNQIGEKQKSLSAVIAAISEAEGAADEQRLLQLQAEQQTTMIEIHGLSQQIQGLSLQQQRLSLVAPSDGIVTTFQVEQLLQHRPVQRGEVLMEIMNEDSPWRLELKIDEHRMGHILQAKTRAGSDRLPVEFVLATAPVTTYSGELESVGTRSEIDPASTGLVVDVTVQLTTDLVSAPRVGAEVSAQIDCGKRSLGYVLFGDVIEYLQKRFWL